MKYYIVDRNDLSIINSVNSVKETALHIWDFEGLKYTRFGPTKFLFGHKNEAINIANKFIDEQLEGYEKQVESITKKKDKLSKVK